MSQVSYGPTAAVVKAASTAAAATDPAAVVTISPNSATVTDGTNAAAVKAASTAAGATDKALVVAISPNNTIPVAGAVASGASDSGNPVKVGGPFNTTQPTVTNGQRVDAQMTARGAQIVATGTDSFSARVTGNAGAAIDGAIAATPPANAIQVGIKAATANPTNATAGNAVAIMGDKAGRQVVTATQVRELIGVQQTNVAATSETTIITAGGAGVFADMVGLIITTAGAVAQTITIKDATAGTTRMVINYPNAAVAPGAPFILEFTIPIPQAAANNNWTVTQSVATACNYTAIFAKNL